MGRNFGRREPSTCAPAVSSIRRAGFSTRKESIMRNLSKWVRTRELRSLVPGWREAFLIAALALVSGPASAALDDPNAEAVYLKKNCGTLTNCTSSVSELTSWIENTRKPNATSPLVVNIGPGTFGDAPLSLSCNKTVGFRGYISFVGVGRSITILDAQRPHSFGNTNTCRGMNFSALSLKNSGAPETTQGYGVVEWRRGGDSTWTDVNIEGSGYAWYEPMCGATGSQHYWHNSQLKVTHSSFSVATAYYAGCDESWFFASELSVTLPANDPYPGNAIVAWATTSPDLYYKGILHFYGSVLRASTDSAGGRMQGAVADRSGAQVHLHGVGMDFVSPSGNPATALSASSGGHIHAAATAYSVHTTGAFTREIIGTGGGSIDAPYFWGARLASLLERVYSVDGEDTAIDTAAADGRPHSLIYRGSCSRRWYDATVDACW
jgi:hypothetical protein